MRVLIDTNRLTDCLRRHEATIKLVERAREVWVPFVTMAEIKAGFVGGKLSEHNELLLRQFLQKPGVAVLYPNRETSDYYARLFNQLRKAGTPIPTNDLWIASLSVQHELALITRDSHFEKLPQLVYA